MNTLRFQGFRIPNESKLGQHVSHDKSLSVVRAVNELHDGTERAVSAINANTFANSSFINLKIGSDELMERRIDAREALQRAVTVAEKFRVLADPVNAGLFHSTVLHVGEGKEPFAVINAQDTAVKGPVYEHDMRKFLFGDPEAPITDSVQPFRLNSGVNAAIVSRERLVAKGSFPEIGGELAIKETLRYLDMRSSEEIQRSLAAEKDLSRLSTTERQIAATRVFNDPKAIFGASILSATARYSVGRI